jgi:hypothetical protein
MKSIITTILLGGLIILASCKQDGCVTKEGFLKTFDGFITEFESKKNSVDLNEEEKLAYEQRYKQMVNDCYKKFRNELTLKERQEFWKSSLRFILDRFDGEVDLNFKDKMDDPFNQYVKDELVAVAKESGLSFLLSLQEVFKDDLPRLMETFSKEFEQIGKGFLDNLFKE